MLVPGQTAEDQKSRNPGTKDEELFDVVLINWEVNTTITESRSL